MKSIYSTRRLAALTLTALAVGGIAACGDDSSSGGGADSGSSGTGKEKAVEVGSAYIGGTAGKADASQSPVTIGWINQDESPAGNAAENTDAMNAAVKFVNEDLGGIDGHPLKVKQCEAGGSEGQGKQCAQKFLNDPEVKAVMFGYVIIGAQSFMATMAPDGKATEKPLISFSPSSPADGALKNAYYTGGGFLSADVTPYFFRDYFKAKTVSQLWSDAPALTPFIAATTASLDKAGISSKVGRIPAAGTDVVGPLVAGGVKTQDALFVLPDDASQCIAMAKGAQQLGVLDKPAVGYSACLDPAVKEALGDAPKWTYFRDALNPDVAEPTGQVDTFKYALNTYVESAKRTNAIQGPYTGNTFGLVMLLAKWANATGADDITEASFAEQAAAPSPIFLGDPDAKFGNQPFPAIAALSLKFYKYEGDSKWTDATDGKWLAVPAE